MFYCMQCKNYKGIEVCDCGKLRCIFCQWDISIPCNGEIEHFVQEMGYEDES